jgi:hypothetical protein
MEMARLEGGDARDEEEDVLWSLPSSNNDTLFGAGDVPWGYSSI